ncbi:hypothetical protein B0H67DRAFT_250172 [Lasiosphaeris hirsuta]|uniref:Transmembrane protein n=1 Tax=Lasiosphaeris hirsuta TaxID=260670 RepID=A0AA40AH58_9PEZI|nr:hypothetical protein B0H67DRAFT_250172 [Lasiosphaeris hirsuta]
MNGNSSSGEMLNEMRLAPRDVNHQACSCVLLLAGDSSSLLLLRFWFFFFFFLLKIHCSIAPLHNVCTYPSSARVHISIAMTPLGGWMHVQQAQQGEESFPHITVCTPSGAMVSCFVDMEAPVSRICSPTGADQPHVLGLQGLPSRGRAIHGTERGSNFLILRAVWVGRHSARQDAKGERGIEGPARPLFAHHLSASDLAPAKHNSGSENEERLLPDREADG